MKICTKKMRIKVMSILGRLLCIHFKIDGLPYGADPKISSYGLEPPCANGKPIKGFP